jgi:hypothetical protein
MKDARFTFVCDRDEREILAVLGQLYQRSCSDTARLLIRKEALRLHITPQPMGKAVEIEDSNQIVQSQSKQVEALQSQLRNVSEDGTQPLSRIERAKIQ